MKNPFKKNKNQRMTVPNVTEMNLGAIKLSPDEMAQILRTTPEALMKFEQTYRTSAINETNPNDLFGINSRQASSELAGRLDECPKELTDAIAAGLVKNTQTLSFKNGKIEMNDWSGYDARPVSKEEVMQVADASRPELTSEHMKCHIPGETDGTLLYMWNQFQKATDPEKKQMLYHMFRQGLDILDLGPVTYAMIGTNPTSMGYWLPEIYQPALKAGFKVPDTVIAKVPITMLQLTRMEYMGHTPATLSIVDKWAEKVFELKEDGDYFIKTGTYSSKFDFRNCRVHDPKEVRELGEYLLFIHSQAIEAAGPLSQPSIYGMSTTNEWVVRSFVSDSQNLPTIYKGLPLRTEYRIFVDFDKKTVIGKSPYWEPTMMKQRFARGGDVHERHDYVTYLTREKDMLAEYEANIDRVTSICRETAQDANLTGQWSVDVMQDGTDLYLIDMAPAENSALYGCVPPDLRMPRKEDWLPEIK